MVIKKIKFSILNISHENKKGWAIQFNTKRSFQYRILSQHEQNFEKDLSYSYLSIKIKNHKAYGFRFKGKSIEIKTLMDSNDLRKKTILLLVED